MATDGWTYTGRAASNPTSTANRSGTPMYALGSASTMHSRRHSTGVRVSGRWRIAGIRPGRQRTRTRTSPTPNRWRTLSMATLNLSRTDPRYAACTMRTSPTSTPATPTPDADLVQHQTALGRDADHADAHTDHGLYAGAGHSDVRLVAVRRQHGTNPRSNSLARLAG